MHQSSRRTRQDERLIEWFRDDRGYSDYPASHLFKPGKNNSARTSTVALAAETEEYVENSAVFIGAIFTYELTHSFAQGELEVFIGLAVAPGYALVDTGAQHGVLGPGLSSMLVTFWPNLA